jgi:hypothetical protein
MMTFASYRYPERADGFNDVLDTSNAGIFAS